MTEPTRLTAEDLPTLRKLAAFCRERKAAERARADRKRSILRKTFSRVLPEAVSNGLAILAEWLILVIERDGHVASDERVDNYGRVSPL